jgi:hypothetical protein
MKKPNVEPCPTSGKPCLWYERGQCMLPAICPKEQPEPATDG